jgi:hypothetical protein
MAGRPEEPSSLAAPGRLEFAAALLAWSQSLTGPPPDFAAFVPHVFVKRGLWAAGEVTKPKGRKT